MKNIRITEEVITALDPEEIFVFGSNLNGFHAGGAAHTACRWGAKWGQGEGLQGNTYAIPTMFGTVEEIKPYVDRFIAFAREHSEMKFLVTPVGCGIAGFSPVEIAPFFEGAVDLDNICLPRVFWENITG